MPYAQGDRLHADALLDLEFQLQILKECDNSLSNAISFLQALEKKAKSEGGSTQRFWIVKIWHLSRNCGVPALIMLPK
jgi:hypothetical protein